MRITLEIPDELAETFALPGQGPARAALEAIGLETYCQRRISAYQLRTLLGMPSRWDLDAFLKGPVRRSPLNDIRSAPKQD